MPSVKIHNAALTQPLRLAVWPVRRCARRTRRVVVTTVQTNATYSVNTLSPDTAIADSSGRSPRPSAARACPRSRISRLIEYHQNSEYSPSVTTLSTATIQGSRTFAVHGLSAIVTSYVIRVPLGRADVRPDHPPGVAVAGPRTRVAHATGGIRVPDRPADLEHHERQGQVAVYRH